MSLASLGHDLLSLLTLFFLEVVLGVDNLIFVSIASSRLPKNQQSKARTLGLLLALVTRLMLLSAVTWLASFTNPLLTIADFSLSGRDILLSLGGVFLLYKGTQEIHQEFLITAEQNAAQKASQKFTWVILQIALLDIIFSLDSVITAIGMTQNFSIMAMAITLAIGVMIMASKALANFIDENPSVKMLAISFIIMVGMVLCADGFHYHIPRPYIYFSIAFSLSVESLNILLRKRKIQNKGRKRS